MRRYRKVWIDGRLDIYQAGGKLGRHEYRPPRYGIEIETAPTNVIFGNSTVGDIISTMIEKNRLRIDTTPSWFGLSFDDTPDSDRNPYWDR